MQRSYIVKAKHWFAAEVINTNDYSLIGCTASPGFDFNDFELPKREQLISKFPQHQILISNLTNS